MTKLRCVLLALYAIIVLGLLGIAFTQTLGLPTWPGLFNSLGSEIIWTIVVLLATVISLELLVATYLHTLLFLGVQDAS